MENLSVKRAATPRVRDRAPLRVSESDGRVEGYASLFGVPDHGGDVVMPGAFAASLRRRGAAACASCSSMIRPSRSACGTKSAKTGAGFTCKGG